jgi:hypothetical protein
MFDFQETDESVGTAVVPEDSSTSEDTAATTESGTQTKTEELPKDKEGLIKALQKEREKGKEAKEFAEQYGERVKKNKQFADYALSEEGQKELNNHYTASLIHARTNPEHPWHSLAQQIDWTTGHVKELTKPDAEDDEFDPDNPLDVMKKDMADMKAALDKAEAENKSFRDEVVKDKTTTQLQQFTNSVISKVPQLKKLDSKAKDILGGNIEKWFYDRVGEPEAIERLKALTTGFSQMFSAELKPAEEGDALGEGLGADKERGPTPKKGEWGKAIDRLTDLVK